MSDPHETSYSLLQRALNLDDNDAWDQLVSSYENFIYYLLRRSNIHECDLDDLNQQVMTHLLRDLKKYDRTKGKFRVWFARLIRSAIRMHYRKRMAEERKANAYESNLEVYFSSDDNALNRYFDQQWERFMSKLAFQRVREKFRTQAFDVFELSLKGVGTQEIMATTGLTEATVYKYKQRVKRSLMIEIASLKKELEP